MKRCHHCLGKFGLIRHRWGFKHFCSRACKNRHLYELALKLAQHRYLAWLHS